MAKKGYLLKGKVIDGSLDAPIEQGAVLTDGALISWVGEAAALPADIDMADYEIVELPGRSILPGLVDAHTHISFGESRAEEENALYTPVEFRAIKAIYNARKILQAGVTSAFDAATTYAVAQAVRDAIDSGMYPGRAIRCPGGRSPTTKAWKTPSRARWLFRPARRPCWSRPATISSKPCACRSRTAWTPSRCPGPTTT